MSVMVVGGNKWDYLLKIFHLHWNNGCREKKEVGVGKSLVTYYLRKTAHWM